MWHNKAVMNLPWHILNTPGRPYYHSKGCSTKMGALIFIKYKFHKHVSDPHWNLSFGQGVENPH